MKRALAVFILIVLCALVLGGCGVKSALEHDPNYPRNYPVY
jgi:predicted small lipoprotein YifL